MRVKKKIKYLETLRDLKSDKVNCELLPFIYKSFFNFIEVKEPIAALNQRWPVRRSPCPLTSKWVSFNSRRSNYKWTSASMIYSFCIEVYILYVLWAGATVTPHVTQPGGPRCHMVMEVTHSTSDRSDWNKRGEKKNVKSPERASPRGLVRTHLELRYKPRSKPRALKRRRVYAHTHNTKRRASNSPLCSSGRTSPALRGPRSSDTCCSLDCKWSRH